ncbi:MAG: hypothetical protein IKJ63_10730 [Clostridia bacterium]|nr:hypothetical protein [Clostridia bacterium]
MLNDILGGLTNNENSGTSATGSENIFSGLTAAFQGIIDLIMGIIEIIRSMVENIIGG